MRRAAAAPPGALRILSANLWNGAADAHAFAALVAEMNPDAAAVQELGHRQAEALAAVLPYGRLEPSDDCTGMGIATRQPTAVHHLALPCRDARLCALAAPAGGSGAGTIELLNVHVQAPHYPLTWRTWQRRRGQWHGLQRHLLGDPARPRIVVGDFNATPRWPLYRHLTAHLHDAALVAEPVSGGAQPTWRPWPGAPRLLRIDHAFVQHLSVIGFQVVDVDGSDHAALIVDVAGVTDGSGDHPAARTRLGASSRK